MDAFSSMVTTSKYGFTKTIGMPVVSIFFTPCQGGKGNRLSNALSLILLSRSPWPSSKSPSDLICDVNLNPKIFRKSPHKAWIFLKPPAYNGKIEAFL